MANAKAVLRTDLGIIYVKTVGQRDLAFLTHNDLHVFAVSCVKGKPLRLWVSKLFLAYPQTQWREVLESYTAWKRQSIPGFKMPKYSGMCKGGRAHPWRGLQHRKKPPTIPPE